MNLDLRDGTSVAPSLKIAGLLWSTAPELYDFMFRGDLALYTRLLEGEWTAQFGFHCAMESTVATDGDEVLGLVISFPAREAGERGFLTFRRYHNTLDGDASAALNVAGTVMSYLFPPAPDDALLLPNIAVDPSVRRRGIGKLLMAAAETKALRLGLSSIHLDTSAEGEAVSFYESMGFTPMTETRLLWLPASTLIPPHVRMVRTLG